MSGEIPGQIEWKPEYEEAGFSQSLVDLHNMVTARYGVSNILEIFRGAEPWEARDLIQETMEAVVRLENRIGYNFGFGKVDFQFMTRREMNRLSPDEEQSLVERYGRGVVGKIIGNCYGEDDGHVVEVGTLGEEEVTRKSVVAATLTHEMGHIVGGVVLDDPVHEELKAYLVSRIILDEMGILDISLEKDTTEVHVAARIMREQLSDAKIPEGASVASLLGEPFLGFEPRDIYFEHGRVRIPCKANQ